MRSPGPAGSSAERQNHDSTTVTFEVGPNPGLFDQEVKTCNLVDTGYAYIYIYSLCDDCVLVSLTGVTLPSTLLQPTEVAPYDTLLGAIDAQTSACWHAPLFALRKR